MKKVVYIHGKGGSADEAAHYASLFPDAEVIGFDYCAETPWEAVDEFSSCFDDNMSSGDVILIANSIGACFSLYALGDKKISRAYFISPVADMEKLICDMLIWAGKTEEELKASGTIETAFGEVLSWKYLTWIREHPVHWQIPTEILYGSKDPLQSFETIRAFADRTNAGLTVMDGGEHWFHTEDQMRFLDDWIRSH